MSNCPKLDTCYKIKMIFDHDLLDFQYAEVIKQVCINCKEKDNDNNLT